MSRKEIDLLLSKVTSNCEYLTNVKHGCQHGHLHQIGESQDLCAVSVARVIIQVSYLLYACSTVNEDVYLLANPVFVRKNKKAACEVVLHFYLSIEESEDKPQS